MTEKEREMNTQTCPICDSNNWEDLDHLRSHEYWYDQNLRYKEPVGFKICKECAFATYNYYPEDEMSKKQTSARTSIGVGNIITCNRKKYYHDAFLDMDLQLSEFTPILDVGCATGYLIAHLRDKYVIDNKYCYGIEFNEFSRLFARRHYDVRAFYDWQQIRSDNIKFNLISYYHVLEHIQNPDQELSKARYYLKDDGYLYLSVPVWFESLEEASGSTCMSTHNHDAFENLYHVNHLNTWSPQGFRNILSKSGFEIVKEERQIYGYTVLCKKSDKKDIIREDYKDFIRKLESQKEAISLLSNKKYDDAISKYPNFPDAYIVKASSQEYCKDLNLVLSILDQGLDATNGSQKIKDHMGMVLMQWDESRNGERLYSNNIKRAEEIFNESIELRMSEGVLFSLGILEYQYKRNVKRSKELLYKVLDINPSRYAEVMNFICKIESS